MIRTYIFQNASLTTAARCTSNTNRSRTDGRIDHQDIEGGRYLGEQKQSRLPDPLRQIFELNKEDFVDAGFCAFCCTNEKDHHAGKKYSTVDYVAATVVVHAFGSHCLFALQNVVRTRLVDRSPALAVPQSSGSSRRDSDTF